MTNLSHSFCLATGLFDVPPSSLLPLLVLFPLLLGAVAVTVLPKERPEFIRIYAFLNTLFSLVIAGVLACKYDWSNPADIQFHVNVPWVPGFRLDFSFAIIDSISLWLVLLTAVLMPIVVLSTFSAVRDRVKEFYFWLLLLQAAMTGVFIANDAILFYVCFEFTLIPLYFLIGIYGSAQRLRAARVFFLYTFTGSMLTLAGILYVAWFHHQHYGRWTFGLITDLPDAPGLIKAAWHMSQTEQTFVLFALLAGFAVKVPLFPFHTWLPLAHTEAPTAGSVVLAGVLLKLGTYGLYRFAIPMCPRAIAVYAPAIAVLAIIGILYTALICWAQKDIKKLIAYSSVSHLGFCVLGMFAINDIGGSGSVMYMINHGLSTGALFLCVGMIYERFHTREMAEMSGLCRIMPVWATFFVFFCLASVGLPGLNGFVGEFLTLMGAYGYDPQGKTGLLGPAYAAVAGIGMIFGAIYILYMVGKVVFGPVKVPAADHGRAAHPHVTDLNAREIACLVPLAVLCLVLGLYPTPMLDSIQPAVHKLNQNTQERVADLSNMSKKRVALAQNENTAGRNGSPLDESMNHSPQPQAGVPIPNHSSPSALEHDPEGATP